MAQNNFPKSFVFFFLLLLPFLQQAQETEHPLIQAMTWFPYSDNTTLEPGHFSLGLDLNYSNVYMVNHPRTIVNDYEMFSPTLRFRYGISKSTALELYFRWFTQHGGFLDKGIEEFHSLFGLPGNGRDDYPRNSVQYRYRDAFFYTEGKTGVSPLQLTLFRDLYSKENFSLKGRVGIGIPLSNTAGLSSGKLSFTAGLVLFYKHKWFSAEFSNYISFINTPDWLTEEDFGNSIFFSRLELQGWRFIGGFMFRTSPFNQDDIAHNAYQGYIGFRISRSLDFLIIEDFVPFDSTPDIGFAFRIKIPGLINRKLR